MSTITNTTLSTARSTYRALRCDALSSDLSGLHFVTLDARAPGPGEVAVRMRAAALNFPDLLMTRGGYQHKPDLPYVVGMEGAGVIEAVGTGVEHWRIGDGVCFSNLTGSFAERNIVPADKLSAIPQGWDFASAAGMPVGASTGYVSLVTRGALQPGEILLVHGATGGMGAAAVQLGAKLGATVIATGTNPEWLELLRPMGATHLLSSRGDFASEVKALTGGRGADVIYDPVGGDVFDKSTKCIAFGGRLLVVGFAAGRIPTVSVNHPLIKVYSVVGVRAGEWMRKRPAEAPGIKAEIARLAAEGVFKPLIGARFAFEQSIEAIRALADRGAPGKIVIEMAG